MLIVLGGKLAKISLSTIFRKRRRIRYLSAASFVLLLLIFFSFLASQNPWSAKATVVVDTQAKTITITNETNCRIETNVLKLCSSSPADKTFDNTYSMTITSSAVVVSGSIKLKNLTIGTGATLMHDALAYPADIQSNGYSLTASGLLKKVDIETTGNITLSGGGSINVDGKGYPGGTPGGDTYSAVGSGLGKAGGVGIKDDGATYYATGGGGNSGSGGRGYYSGNTWESAGGAGDSATMVDTNGFLPGSGAGSGKRGIYPVIGGAGGGRVHLKAGGMISISSDSSISANGVSVTSIWALVTGGGGGGTIWLEAQKNNFSYSSSTFAARANKSTAPTGIGHTYDISQVATDGGVTVRGLDQSNAVLNISADGGSGFYYNANLMGGPGGGGKIYVMTVQDFSGTKISKKLEALERPAGTSNTTFNPYATVLGDKIKVTITVTGLKVVQTVGQTVAIDDDLLHLPQNASLTGDLVSQRRYCAPVAGSYSPVSPAVTATTISWVIPNAGTTTEASYNCTITAGPP